MSERSTYDALSECKHINNNILKVLNYNDNNPYRSCFLQLPLTSVTYRVLNTSLHVAETSTQPMLVNRLVKKERQSPQSWWKRWHSRSCRWLLVVSKRGRREKQNKNYVPWSSEKRRDPTKNSSKLLVRRTCLFGVPPYYEIVLKPYKLISYSEQTASRTMWQLILLMCSTNYQVHQ